MVTAVDVRALNGRNRLVGFAAVTILLTHLQLSLVAPDEGWTTSAGMVSLCLLAIVFCTAASLTSATGMRLRWLLMSSVFMLWSAAYVAIAYFQAVLHLDQTRVHIDVLLYMLRAVPLLWLLSEPRKPLRGRALSAALGEAAFFAILLVLLLFPSLLQGAGAPEPSDAVSLAYHDVQNFGLAVLAVLAVLRYAPEEQHSFNFALAMLLAVYAVDAWLLNHLSINASPPPPPGSVINVAGELPIVAFLLVAAGAVPAPQFQPPASIGRLAERVRPLAFCCASIIAAIGIGVGAPLFGVSLGTGAIMIHLARARGKQHA
jgi:hypothetical protein